MKKKLNGIILQLRSNYFSTGSSNSRQFRPSNLELQVDSDNIEPPEDQFMQTPTRLPTDDQFQFPDVHKAETSLFTDF